MPPGIEVSEPSGGIRVLRGLTAQPQGSRIVCRCLQLCTRHRKSAQASSASHAHVVLQVEVKLRLPGAEAHQKLEQLLAPGRMATHQQVCVVVMASLPQAHNTLLFPASTLQQGRSNQRNAASVVRGVRRFGPVGGGCMCHQRVSLCSHRCRRTTFLMAPTRS
jgi:hypothetical protein